MTAKSESDHLIETRQILELAAVKMAAERRTQEDLRDMQNAQNAFRDEILDRRDATEEDLLFHLKVVTAGKNDVLKSLFMKLIPDLLTLFGKNKNRDNQEFFTALREHDSIIGHISDRNKEEAVAAMESHLEKWKS